MATEFKASVGKRVSKKEAKAWIEKYDQEFRKEKDKDTRSVFYGRDALLRILSEEGTTGITFFLALKYNEAVKKETVQLVLVPTKEDGKLLWPDDGDAQKLSDIEGGAYDYGKNCPPDCPSEE